MSALKKTIKCAGMYLFYLYTTPCFIIMYNQIDVRVLLLHIRKYVPILPTHYAALRNYVQPNKRI